jgi:hypothetical protein
MAIRARVSWNNRLPRRYSRKVGGDDNDTHHATHLGRLVGEDWLGAGLSLVDGVTPWLVGDTTDANIHS